MRFVLLFLAFFAAVHAVRAFTIQDSQSVMVTATVPDSNQATTSTSTPPNPGNGNGGGNAGGGGFNFYSSGIQYNVSATSSTSTASSSNLNTLTTDQLQKLADQQVADLIAYGNQQLKIKVTSLNLLYSQTLADPDVPQTTKDRLFSEINALKRQLRNLRLKINADTDLETTTNDVNSIFLKYRITYLVIPRYTIIINANKVYSVVQKMNGVINKFNAKIGKKTDQDEINILSARMADLTSEVADAIKQAIIAEQTVTPLVPDLGNIAVQDSNKALLTAALAHITLATQDLTLAWKNADSLRILLGMNSTSTAAVN